MKGWRYRPNLVINIPACQLLIHLKLNLMRHFLYLFYMQYISHDFVTEDIKQELLPSTVTKKGSTIKTNCSDLILKPKLGSNNHIHHLKLKNRETRFFFNENHLWFGVDFHWAPLLYIVWTPKCPNKPYNLGPRKGPQSVSITLTKSLRSQVEISKFWEY